MKRSLCSLVALGLLMGVTGRAMAQQSYTFTTLDLPGSSYASDASANGINDAGQMVGVYSDAAYHAHGFQFDQGSYTTLDGPGSSYTEAHGISLHQRPDATGNVESVAFHPKRGEVLAWGSFDGTVKIWNIATGEIRIFHGHRNMVQGVAFSPDGEWLPSASHDGTVKIWKVPNASGVTGVTDK